MGSGNIVEAITRTGIRTTNLGNQRPRYPHPGDHVRWADGTLGRIDSADFLEPDEFLVCENQGSAFLLDSGQVSISGGPFKVVKKADLTPTFALHLSKFWNWGDNSPGADKGVEFYLARPVFAYEPAAVTP